MQALMVKRAIEVQRHNVVVIRRGPTKLEVEHHVASGHAQHRTWCDARTRARGIAGRHEKREQSRGPTCCGGLRLFEA